MDVQLGNTVNIVEGRYAGNRGLRVVDVTSDEDGPMVVLREVKYETALPV